MANWTEKELEELMAKMTQKSMTDAAFRKEVLEDATKALEKLAGRPLPEGSSLKCIEKDPNYQTTLVLPDFVDEEKLDDEALSNVAGGISVAAIVSICMGAIGLGPDVGFCKVKACAADACGAYVTGDDKCAAQACAKDAGTEPNRSCAAKGCYSH
jgi:hypothetical protein